MLLYMAESNFQFAVTPIPVMENNSTDSSNPSQDEPTMKSVDAVQTFIKKCQQMAVDGKEYEFLRMLVLFNAGELILYFCHGQCKISSTLMYIVDFPKPFFF